MLNNKKVLVTGATGFIGGRLVERIILGYPDARIRVLLRSFTKAAKISRFDNIDFIKGDIKNKDDVIKATEGVDIIFHCAYGDKSVIVDGLKNICDAALSNKVKKIVYLSTISVFGESDSKVIDDSFPLKSGGDEYSESKIESEKIAMNYFGKNKLPISIIRPTIVYGPNSGNWTTKFIEMIKKNELFLIDGGQGVCNHVYIDNLIDGIMLAAKDADSNGKAYTISDGCKTTWKEFLSYYSNIIGCGQLEDYSMQELRSIKKKRLNIIYNIKELFRAMNYIYFF